MDPAEPQVIRIELIWYGRPVTSINISVDETVMELKKKIEANNAIGLVAEKQELHFNGQSLKDEMKLEHYEIPNDATITVFTKIQISVRKDRVSYPFDAHNGMTVGDLYNMVSAQFGKPTDKIVLDLAGELLVDEHRLLSAVDFDGSEVYFN
ncbi:uncharacterized protein LOC112491255 [Ziziphus jujuba]|uniref:Uncharacterized protein LOC112491255 n=1 Tax=Ziziphus jujuba TaxID=326968 RepID=A0A6P6G3I9_ZIZJJ|nr:uncharacterized protein LOC112491255 [Ziziphus jujuba]